jgi:T-complex protein 1 subunit zeta
MAQVVNPNAEVIGRSHALQMNCSAARSLQGIVKTNLGPKGTMKMLVSGAGAIEVTKDGKILLDKLPIMHPTAALISRQAAAQDEITGDGTTSSILLTGELMTEAERICSKGLHPRLLIEGYEKAKDLTLQYLDEFKSLTNPQPKEGEKVVISDDILYNVAKTSLRTKVPLELADHLADVVVKAVKSIYQPEKHGLEVDLHMIEIMAMKHGSATDTRFIDGLVLDHGARHPGMSKRSEKCAIFVCNFSLEYEKAVNNSTMMYKSTAHRDKLVAAERKYTDDKVRQIIQFKEEQVGKDGSFILINQGGIDPISLDLLQKGGIVAIRRAKRRNMERLSRACGGYAITALENLTPDCLGYADLVYEHALQEEVYTFVEGCKGHKSCTILVNGPNDHTILQIKAALRDGLRAVANTIQDQCVIPGAGAFELFAHFKLLKYCQTNSDVSGKVKIGIRAYAESLLVIPKTLAQNAGFDAQTTVVEIQESVQKNLLVGIDLDTGKALIPSTSGVYDNYCVKKQYLSLSTSMCSLVLVDEVIRSGKKGSAPAPGAGGMGGM